MKSQMTAFETTKTAYFDQSYKHTKFYKEVELAEDE